MNLTSSTVLSAKDTARCLPYPELVASLGKAVAEYAAGKIQAPERQVLAYPQGGRMLSMPAVAQDLGVHKLVNVMPGNPALGLPAIQALVAVYDARTGQPLALLDGATVTARRTAAMSMLGIQALWPQGPAHVALLGGGQQALAHADAVLTLYPTAQVTLHSRTPARAEPALAALRTHHGPRIRIGGELPANADVVIALTSSPTPVYHEAARPDRLLIGVGAFRPDMAEFEARTVLASRLYVDDLNGARHEAGDFLQADVDWEQVHGIHQVLRSAAPRDKPLFFKSVGCAAWDLAAARCALQMAESD
ncbi:delta(1)-pyrroline-2-carboxylate reductase family protein [Alcaligenes sp. SDU_A2]|uniref:delta(1)-pyrroline-2-carboxylate reductase family protein n=1 Tax=Alcaligenes sp. SDU_A2 TaxID=3136634 RepID=UPI00311FA768